MFCGLPARLLCFVVVAVSLVSSPAIAQVQINQNFIAQGPSPSVGPFDIVGSADAANGAEGTVTGAVQAILLDPMLGPKMFIGSPNGGGVYMVKTPIGRRGYIRVCGPMTSAVHLRPAKERAKAKRDAARSWRPKSRLLNSS
jgi:hypothetical protein